MAIAISTSIKLYLNLAALITQEVLLSKEFYSLAIEIMKVLSLREIDRNIDGIVFLNECYNKYKQLVEASTLLKTSIRRDELVRIKHIDTSYMSGSDTASFSSEDSPKSQNILVHEHNEL